MTDMNQQLEEPSVTAGNEVVEGFCTQECVWMGRELDRLTEEVNTLKEKLKAQVEACDELRKENSALLARLKLVEIKPVIVTNSVRD